MPKPAGQRRRRNKDVPVPVVLDPGAKRKAPAMPGRPDGRAWLKLSREWWARVWGSPIAPLYVDAADVDGLARLAELREDAVREGVELTLANKLRLAAEVRLLEDRYGLSPSARLRMRAELRLDGTGDEAPVVAAVDEERFLRAIDGGKGA